MYDTFRRTRVNVNTQFFYKSSITFFMTKQHKKKCSVGQQETFFLIQAFLHARKWLMQILKDIIIMVNAQFKF